ncbi:FHIPEP family type III secretion protein [Geodermatophilus sp. URMC 63]
MTATHAAEATLTVAVGVGPGVVAEAPPQAVTDRVTAEVTALVRRLGIPGAVRVELGVVPASDSTGKPVPLRLGIGGRPCRFSEDVVVQAFAYAVGTADVPASLPDEVPAEAVADWMALVCREAAAQSAHLLLTRDQVEVYCLAHDIDAEDPDAQHRVHAVLQQVVGLGRSIADGDTVRNVLRATGAADTDEVTETLAGALRSPRLDIRMDPASLRQLTCDHRADGAPSFSFLRESLFDELGLRLPALHLVADPALAAGGFAVDLDDLPGLPRIGLTHGTVLVNDTPERLRLMGVDGTSCLIPGLSQPGSIVAQDATAMLEAAGLTTWDALGFLVLSVAGVVRESGYRWMDPTAADALLDTFSLVFPEAERVARACVPLSRLAVVLRDLLRDGLSIRNLRRILEVLTDAELDGRLPPGGEPAVDLVRTALREEIAHRAARGTSTVVVYLLDPELEDAVAAGVDNGGGRRLSDALRRELTAVPAGLLPPAILTRRSVRPFVRAAIRPQFPRVRVLDYDDLPPRMNVQPVARLSAD